MVPLMSRLMPGATGMIRADHSRLLVVLHRYRGTESPAARQAPVRAGARLLEIHAALEEEIFYPACRAAGIDNPVLDKSLTEHAEMHRLIEELRAADPASAAFDQGVMALMRVVLHHMADEETVLLPDAERVLGPDRLAELGLQMTRRRLQLAAPQAGEIAADTLRNARPASVLMAAGVLLAGGYMVKRAFGHNGASARR